MPDNPITIIFVTGHEAVPVTVLGLLLFRREFNIAWCIGLQYADVISKAYSPHQNITVVSLKASTEYPEMKFPRPPPVQPSYVSKMQHVVWVIIRN